MTNLNQIFEDMAKHGDLKGMVLPKISIDQYESKAGRNASIIPVALYAKNANVAQDIRNFIERGEIELVDAEVAPNPDEQGHWVVFIEFERNRLFWECFFGVIDQVEHLIGKPLKWEVRVLYSKTVFTLDDPKLKLAVATTPYKYVLKKNKNKTNKVTEQFLSNFLRDSSVQAYSLLEDGLTLKSSNQFISTLIENYGSYKNIGNIITGPISLNSSDDERLLKQVVGPGYDIGTINNRLYIQNLRTSDIMLLTRE